MVSACACLRFEWSGFEPWQGTLCCVLGQDTSLSQCLSPPRCINKWIPVNWMLGGPCDRLASHPRRGGGIEILLVTSCYRNRRSSGLMNHLACMQTLYLPYSTVRPAKIWSCFCSLRTKRSRTKSFSAFWPRVNWSESKNSTKQGVVGRERERLPANPSILKNPFVPCAKIKQEPGKENQSLIVSFVNLS